MAISPKNWKKFQHYSDRKPAWIKLHRDLIDDYAFTRLPFASQALAPRLWLLASEYDEGKIAVGLEEIAFKVRWEIADLISGLKPLIEHGFFIDDSDALASCKQFGVLEEEREIEIQEHKEATSASSVAIAPAAVPELDLSSGKSPSMAKALMAAAIAPKLFDDFWEAYPKRDGANPKEPARKRFLAALKSGEDADAIIAAAKAYRDELRRTGKAGTQYVARAVTWLSERRWADYAAVVANAQAPPGHKAAPGSAEFVAWRTHWRDTGNRVMVQLLDQRELEGRSFEFLAQWPPGIEMADRRDVA